MQQLGGFGGLMKAMGHGAIRGIEGKDKTRWADQMSLAAKAGAPGSGIENNKLFRGVGGFVADVATDPLTWVTPELNMATSGLEAGGAGAKAIEAGAAAGHAAPNLVSAAEAATKAAKVAKPGSIGLSIAGR